MSKKILVLFGTRPECIKLAPIVAELRRRPEQFSTFVCASGQHREMLAQTLAAFDLVPDEDLAVMRHDQGLAELTAQLITKLTQTIRAVQPDLVLVQGDTATAFAGALAAFYQRIAVGHVEAGLRSYQRYNPFPEEGNRKLIGALADLHFAPTQRAVDALRREAIDPAAIHLTGNTVVDALLALRARLDTPAGAGLVSATIRNIAADAGRIVLITCHRRESFGDDLAAICRAIRRIALAHPQLQFVFPVHLNPNVRAQVMPLLGDIGNVSLLDPLGYVDFIYLLSRSVLALSDSGGIQEEAPSFGVPVLVLRSTTERQEGIDAGFAELVGADEELIVARAAHLLQGATAGLSGKANPYGDGTASRRIVDVIGG
ncbi:MULTISPECIES: UDP-N-acetylglucosamine 2-epimerase (non-hydrolyzing) [Rhodopseudomonas]|uniref:UDP-N-acetylglucosamine 2-epimerase (non-hydrolyzing) n=1 Tax=Rhodopseudomonas palustris TaxID=1076 RepID=A0A0D7EI29_RHOPL|nr:MULTISPECIES: UDP-N-acetylglucosamine 2-epimerase (non-hydrolyzing) [Rhodopseudomonas]KIZ39172.1 UDP-N-acetylglucosamine 2-epimerase [Rhodopseudomonas palustris]MDF3809989.1 UDP-N-acetylglucosamine 2-epimerase (non-hydrolyzing) [Rhodopseudomonas sp. BAL398]WOK20453.1 UDP-N-acetylglucosamine 2-epimerase (non-hydrolyzing) [Rhodopseudomonas sp. BAL398]